jgi:hypothetical protein
MVAIIQNFNCSASQEGKGGSGDSDYYLTNHLPNQFRIDTPKSITPKVSGSLDFSEKTVNTDVKTVRAEMAEAERGLAKIKEAVEYSRYILLNQAIEWEYILADAYYPKVKRYVEENETNIVPEEIFYIKFTAAMKNRLLAVATQYISRQEALDYIKNYLGIPKVGEKLWNPIFKYETPTVIQIT